MVGLEELEDVLVGELNFRVNRIFVLSLVLDNDAEKVEQLNRRKRILVKLLVFD